MTSPDSRLTRGRERHETRRCRARDVLTASGESRRHPGTDGSAPGAVISSLTRPRSRQSREEDGWKT
jgi:hypothetical protein